MPSFLSSVAAQRPKYEASSNKPSLWLVSIPFICRLDSELDRDWSVGGDLFQDRFGAGDEIRRRDKLVDEPDTIGLLRR